MEYGETEIISCIAGEHQVQSHTYMQVYVYPTSFLARYQKLTYVLKSKAGGYVEHTWDFSHSEAKGRWCYTGIGLRVMS